MADTWLKQSTSVSVVIGPIWATADGALKADLAYNASGINCDIYKNGTKADVTLANSAGDGYFRAASGEALYLLTLSTGHTDTLGRLEISLSATGYYMKPRSYMVVPANVWDSMFGADYLKTEVVEISGDSTAADNLEADYDGTGYAKTNSTTKLHADYDAAKTAASQSSVNTIDDFLDTEVAAILADTNELQTDLTNGGRLDLLIDAIKAKTDNLPADPADDSDIDAQLAAIAGYLDTEVAAILAAVDTEVAAIKAKTDNLPASPAAVGSQMDLVNAPNATAVTAIQSGLATAAALDAVDNFVDTEVGAIKAVTDKLDTALELDGAVYRYTTNALEQASGTGATAQQVWEYTTRSLTDKAGFGLADDAITSAKFDETTAYPLKSADTGATAVARTGADGDTLEDLSDEIATMQGNVTDILADTNELQTNQGNWATATGFSTHSAADVKTAIEAAGSHLTLIKAKTDNLPANPAAVGSAMTLHADYDAAKTAAQAGDEMDLVDAPNVTAVAAIQSGLSTLSAGDVADAVWDESTASHTSSGTFGRLLNLLRRLLFNRQVDSGNSVENFDDDGETSLGTASWSESTGTRGKHTVAW